MRKAVLTMALVLAALPLAAHARVAAPPAAPDWVLASGAASPALREGHAMAYDAARGRVVLFGGANEYDVFDFGDTWEWTGSAWVERTPASSPPARFGHGMAYDAARGRVVLFGGYEFYSGRSLGDTWEWDGSAWVERAPATSPAARYGPAMAYDATRGRVVLFGGAGAAGNLADTWEWDGSDWVERDALAGPPPREYAAMTYDGARGRVVLFGGHAYDGSDRYLSDTWEWDGASWTDRTPTASPPGRLWHGMAYESPRGRVVLFGGYDGDAPLGDTWEWDGGAWVERATFDGPAPRLGHAMAYDAATERVVLFGGFSGRAPLDDTWEWLDGAWVERTPAASPPPRSDHAAAYDAARGRVVIFGGYAGFAFLGDTWEWDGSAWRERTPATSPPPRVFHAMAYDAARGRVVLFGGYGRSGPVADTWEWDGTSWTERTPAAGPPARFAHAMAYDGARGRVVLFAGSDGFSYLGDTWEWDGSAWVEAAPAASPVARAYHAMAYDGTRGRTVLFGGLDALSFYSDTWEWDGREWLQAPLAAEPPARSDHGLAYDAARGRMVLFGGCGFSGCPAGDTWEWDGLAWEQARPATSARARLDHAMTYDTARGRVVIVGGFGGEFLADTWEYGAIPGCAHAARVIRFEPGDGGGASAADALGPPDGRAVSLGLPGGLVLFVDPPVRSGAGADLVVHATMDGGETAAGGYRVEASTDGAEYLFLRECPAGECQLDLTQAGLDLAGYVRISSVRAGDGSPGPSAGAGIDAVTAIHSDGCGNRPPVAIAGPDQVLECEAARQATALLDGSLSTDPDSTPGTNDDIVSFLWSEGGAPLAVGARVSVLLGLGSHRLTLTVTDRAGNVATCETSVTVADTAPPVVTVQASPAELWPPDHRLAPVRFSVRAADACDPAPEVLLLSSSSSEPDDAPGGGDGKTTGDIRGAAVGTPDFDVLLRAERDGSGPGRTYVLRYRAVDAAGNAATSSGAVRVPHDRR